MQRSFSADMSRQAVIQGIILAFVGYAASVAIVVQGLRSVGASTAQIASALVAASLAKGVLAIFLSLKTKMPISIVWSTPGMALLAVTPAVAGGFPSIVGAFFVAGVLIVLTGLSSTLGQLIQKIPKSIANAMLAGILLKLCLAPFLALQQAPLAAGAILATWIVMMKVARLYAVPAAVAVAVGFIVWSGSFKAEGSLLPMLVFVAPVFSWEAVISVAIPLYLVTMTSQNITGLAVLGTFDYRPDPKLGLVATGLASAATAPLVGPTVNFAAITAALCAGPDAHPDPQRRYVAAVIAGFSYIVLASVSGVATALIVGASPLLIEAAAGLALLGSLASATAGALQAEEDRIPAIAALLVTASGLALFGIGPAFWGLVAGCGLYAFFRLKISPDLTRR
jgi:benzoate membrane transport protein